MSLSAYLMLAINCWYGRMKQEDFIGITVMEDGKAISTACSLISTLGQQHGKLGAREQNYEDKLISLEQVERL